MWIISLGFLLGSFPAISNLRSCASFFLRSIKSQLVYIYVILLVGFLWSSFLAKGSCHKNIENYHETKPVQNCKM